MRYAPIDFSKIFHQKISGWLQIKESSDHPTEDQGRQKDFEQIATLH